MKLVKKLLFILVVIVLFVALSIPYETFMLLSNNMVVTTSEFQKLKNLDNAFLTCISSSVDNNNKYNEELLEYKLFNMFDILNLKVRVVQDDEYYVGGNTLGISLKSKGVILVGGNFIITKNGIEQPFADSDLQTGDIILAINDSPINGVEDISTILKETKKFNFDISYAVPPF